jgi:hypothetical protein
VPDHVEAFPNDLSKVLVAYPVSVRVSHFICLRSLGDARSLGDSATLGTEAARGLATDQSTSASSGTPARFHRKVIILELDYNVVSKTAPPSVLKLLVDWPATKGVRVQPIPRDSNQT